MNNFNIERRGITYGLLITCGLIVYFFAMKALGLVHNIELRVFNAFIMFAGIYFAIRNYKRAKGDDFEYLKGAGVGLLATLITAVTFSAFISIYTLNNPEFMASIKVNEPQGWDMNGFGIAVIIFIEAAASGFIFTYMCMQWFKTPVKLKSTDESGNKESKSSKVQLEHS